MISDYTQLEITDRTLTFRFNDHLHTAFENNGWAAPSAEYAISTLGSRTLLGNVMERITFNLFRDEGESDSVIEAAVATLDQLLFNAVRYGMKRDRSVAPVLFRCLKQGSNKWLAAQLTGAQIRTTLPDDFVIKTRSGEATITVEFERRGELILDGYFGENLISTNSSFEEFDGTNFPGWLPTANPALLARVTSVATEDDAYSAQIYFDGGSTPAGIYRDISGLTPGEDYRASVYGINPTSERGYLILSDTDELSQTSVMLPPFTLSQTRISAVYTCPSDGVIRASLVVDPITDTYIEVDAIFMEIDTGSPGAYDPMTAASQRQGSSDSTTDALDILTSTFAMAQTQSALVELTLAGYVNDQSLLPRSFLAVAKQADDIHLFATGLGGTQTSVSTNSESGGQISTFAGTANTRSVELSLPSTLRARKIEVLIMARNASASAECYVSAFIHNPNSPSVGAGVATTENSPYAAVIPATSTEVGAAPVVRPYYLGVLQRAFDPIEAIWLSINPSTVGSSYSLIIDTVLVINRDDDIHSRILVLEPSLDSGVYSSNADDAILTLALKPKILTDRHPFFGLTKSDDTNEVQIPYRGDTSIRTTGNQIAVCWFYSNGTKYAPQGTLTFTAERDLAYRTPM